MNIPCIDSDYPLFDWADWPNSKAALVKGTPTKQFEIACWDDIVTKLIILQNDAGYSWNDAYTDASGAVIQRSAGGQGKFRAACFNSTRNNIDALIALPWQWEKNPAFRGYIGHKDMVGLSTVSSVSKADKLYPEYILLLVERMNLLIRILRGDEDDLADARSEIILNEKWEIGAVSKRVAPGEAKFKVITKRSPAAVVKIAAPFDAERLLACPTEVSKAAARVAAPFAGEILVGVKHSRPEVTAVPKRKVWPLNISIYANSGVQEGLSSRGAAPIDLSPRSFSEINWGGVACLSAGACVAGRSFSDALGTSLATQPAASIDLDGNTRTNANGSDIVSQPAVSIEPDGGSTITVETLFLSQPAASAEIKEKMPVAAGCDACPRLSLTTIFERRSNSCKEAMAILEKSATFRELKYRAGVIPAASIERVRYSYLGSEQLCPCAMEAEGHIEQICVLLVDGKTHPVQCDVKTVAYRRAADWEAQLVAPVKSGASASSGKRLAADVCALSLPVSKSAEVTSGIRRKLIADIQINNPVRFEACTHLGRVDYVLPDAASAPTQAEAEVARAKPVATETASISRPNTDAQLDDDLRPAPTGSETVAAASSMVAQIACKLPDGQIAAGQVSNSNGYAELVTGWLPPIWVGDGLHIRQVHDDPTLNDNGELVIT